MVWVEYEAACCLVQVPVQLRGQRRVQQAVVLRRLPPPGHVAVGSGEDHPGDQPLRVNHTHCHCRVLLGAVALCTVGTRRAQVHNKGLSPGHSLCEVAAKADIHVWTRHLLFHRRVFAIKYRTIPCNQPIANEAKQVGKLLSDPHANQKPAGLNCASQVTGCCLLLVQRLNRANKAATQQAFETAPLQHAHIKHSKHNMHMVAQQHALIQSLMLAGPAED
jgi:hypothetical protein